MRVSNLRREILGIKQEKRKALHTYWERFKELLVRCPQHGISDYQLYNCFCEGLTPIERRLISASNGGSLGDMTPTEIKELIEKLVVESKYSENKDELYRNRPRRVKEVSNVHLEAQISKLTKAIMLLMKEKAVAKKPCGICLKMEHPIDICSLLQEDTAAAKAIGGNQNNYHNNFQQKQKYQIPPGLHQQQNYQQLGF